MIPPELLKIEVIREDRGGQHTNGPERSAVKITYLPTGASAQVGDSRSQHLNRQSAMRMIEFYVTDPEG